MLRPTRTGSERLRPTMKFVLASYGTRGDIEPSAALGRELQGRGHEVWMAVPPDLVKGQRFAFIGDGNANLLASPFKFARHGKSRQEISELLPHLGHRVRIALHRRGGRRRGA